MIQVWIVILSLFSFEAFAQEFKHITLSPQFEQYLNQPKLKSSRSMKSSISADNEFSQKIRAGLLGGGSAKSSSSPFPTDGEESPLFEEIRGHLENAHEEIGLRQITQLDFLNRQFDLGSENLSGFSWQKPFGVVHVFADRQVTQDIMSADDKWVVCDTFTFDVEATTFLENANEAGITNMSDAEIGAFAGITFKRVYTYYHYANSYQEGLRSDFSKLFLPFVKFNLNGISRMNDDEIMKREDNWSARVGGMITSPPIWYVSASAGVLAEYGFQQMVAIQNNEPQDQSEQKIHLIVKSKKNASIAATLELQVEFFKILKITILSGDLTYEYASSKEYGLGFSESEWQQSVSDPVEGSELRKIVRGFGSVNHLEPYVVRLEEAESSSFQARGSILIWGRLKKNKTELIRGIKDQTTRFFFKNYSQNVRVVQNFLSRLFSAVIYKIFKFPVGTKNASLYSREITMEYEATHPQASNPNIARIDSTEQFSFILTQSYEAGSTHRWIDQRFKNDVIWFVDNFTSLPKDYKMDIRNERLRGPLYVESNLRVEKAGFDYLLAQEVNDIFGHIARVCKSRRVSSWKNESKRKKFLRRLQIGRESCVKKIGKNFLSFKKDYEQNNLKPSLTKFKNFLSKYYKKTESLTSLIPLFGEGNIFLNGTLKAKTSTGTNFTTSFSAGQFRGLGVIDNFKRSSGSRMPASIVSE